MVRTSSGAIIFGSVSLYKGCASPTPHPRAVKDREPQPYIPQAPVLGCAPEGGAAPFEHRYLGPSRVARGCGSRARPRLQR
jgi:hypothetical protein